MKFNNIEAFKDKSHLAQEKVESLITQMVEHLNMEVSNCFFLEKDSSSLIFYFDKLTSNTGVVEFDIHTKSIQIIYSYNQNIQNMINSYIDPFIERLKIISDYARITSLNYLVLSETEGFKYKVVIFGKDYTLISYINNNDIENKNYENLKLVFAKKNFAKGKYSDYRTAEALVSAFDTIVTLAEVAKI